jgi:hypothetical protein
VKWLDYWTRWLPQLQDVPESERHRPMGELLDERIEALAWERVQERDRSSNGGKARMKKLRKRKAQRVKLLRATYPRQPDRNACRTLTTEARKMIELQAPLLLPPVNATEWLNEITEALVEPPS